MDTAPTPDRSARRALAPREVPAGRRWTPRTALTPSRALPVPGPEDVASDVVVWSRWRDAVQLAALFGVVFVATRLITGRGADLAVWAPVSLMVVVAVLALFLIRRHRIEADAGGVRRLGPLGWELGWDEIAELRLDATRDAAGRPGWFRPDAPGGSVALEIAPRPGASRRRLARGAVHRECAAALGALARFNGVRTREAAAAAARRAAS